MKELLCKIFSVHMSRNWPVVSFVGDSYPHVPTHSHATFFLSGFSCVAISQKSGRKKHTIGHFLNAWNGAYLLKASHKKSS